MIIRKITVEDAEKFLALKNHIDKSGFMMFEPNERNTTVAQEKAFIISLLNRKNSTIFVAEMENELVGFLVVIGGEFTRNQHSAYLVLGVHEDFHGRGVATWLFEETFLWAKEVGISRLGLTVIKNNYRAFDLYRKMGFVLEGEKVHSLMINGVAVNEYYMYRLL